MSTEQRCPECGGERMVNHPTLFEWRHELSCSLLAREDSRKVADDEVIRASRTLTETERTLLEACGVELDSLATVRFDHLQVGVRVRKFYRSDGTQVILDAPEDIHPGITGPAPRSYEMGAPVASPIAGDVPSIVTANYE